MIKNICSVKEKKLQTGNHCRDADVDWAESERKFVQTNHEFIEWWKEQELRMLADEEIDIMNRKKRNEELADNMNALKFMENEEFHKISDLWESFTPESSYSPDCTLGENFNYSKVDPVSDIKSHVTAEIMKMKSDIMNEIGDIKTSIDALLEIQGHNEEKGKVSWLCKLPTPVDMKERCDSTANPKSSKRRLFHPTDQSDIDTELFDFNLLGYHHTSNEAKRQKTLCDSIDGQNDDLTSMNGFGLYM